MTHRDHRDEIEVVVAALSHDLRAPLRAIDAYMRLLAAELPSTVSAAARRYIERTCRSVGVARGLVDEVLDFVRCGQRTLKLKEIDLSALARCIVDELRIANTERRISVHIEADLRAVGDPVLVRRLLQNLLGNAWKFTQHAQHATIRLFAIVGAEQAVFCVEDNGCGSIWRRLGSSFSRFDASMRRTGTTGMAWGSPSPSASWIYTQARSVQKARPNRARASSLRCHVRGLSCCTSVRPASAARSR